MNLESIASESTTGRLHPNIGSNFHLILRTIVLSSARIHRSLRCVTRHSEGERVILARRHDVRINSAHVRDEDTSGATALCIDGCPRFRIGRNGVGRLASGLSAAARPAWFTIALTAHN